jgi:hypothetical protein
MARRPVHENPVNLREWRAAAGKSTDQDKAKVWNTEQFGSENLTEEQKAYYGGTREGMEHREKLSTIKGAAAKNAYTKGIREGMTQNDRPKRGDVNNPLRKDMPREPSPPRQPRAVNPIRKAQRNARQFSKLARLASGKRRR